MHSEMPVLSRLSWLNEIDQASDVNELDFVSELLSSFMFEFFRQNTITLSLSNQLWKIFCVTFDVLIFILFLKQSFHLRRFADIVTESTRSFAPPKTPEYQDKLRGLF